MFGHKRVESFLGRRDFFNKVEGGKNICSTSSSVTHTHIHTQNQALGFVPSFSTSGTYCVCFSPFCCCFFIYVFFSLPAGVEGIDFQQVFLSRAEVTNPTITLNWFHRLSEQPTLLVGAPCWRLFPSTLSGTEGGATGKQGILVMSSESFCSSTAFATLCFQLVTMATHVFLWYFIFDLVSDF